MQWSSKHGLDETAAMRMFGMSYQGPAVNTDRVGVLEIHLALGPASMASTAGLDERSGSSLEFQTEAESAWSMSEDGPGIEKGLDELETSKKI